MYDDYYDGVYYHDVYHHGNVKVKSSGCFGCGCGCLIPIVAGLPVLLLLLVFI